MPAMTPPAFDPARYPRSYTASAGWLAFGILAGAAFVFIAIMALRDAASATAKPSPFVEYVLCAGLMLFGFAVAAVMLRVRVALGASFIEARGILWTWRLRREDIVDYRVQVINGVREFRLRTAARRRPFKFTQVFKADDAFIAWFSGLVDSDRLQHEDTLKRIAADETLGATPALRLEGAARARRFARWLLIPCTAATLWAWAYPRPYALAMSLMAALPVAALALAWRCGGLFSLADSKTSPRGDLSPLLIAPAVVLAARAMLDTSLTDPFALVFPALVAGALLALLAIAACAELRAAPVQAVLSTLILMLYAAGALALADEHFDRRFAMRTPATIAGKHHSNGKAPQGYFDLEGLPGHAPPAEFRVGFDLYRGSTLGDRVCLIEHPGALGWRWTQVDTMAACDAG
jgi:hypothetical protein